jgi:four helix bundle protein
MARYEQLKAWQLAHGLVLQIYRVTESFPADERFGLTAQMRRAAFSVAANLVEGSARRGPREFRRFLDIAGGSLAELRYALVVARDLGYLTGNDWKTVDEQRDEVGRVVWALNRAIAGSADRPS